MVPLGGPRRRTMLALLIAAGDTGVTMDALVEGVYASGARSTSHRSLLTFVSDYRASLGGVIVRRGDRYVVDVGLDGSIDADRFERAVVEAQRRRDEPFVAELLRSALSAWRGDPYADVESVELDIERRRLNELRVTALETRFELELTAGLHRDLIPELEAVVAQHPERETLCALQMVALYRSGRQADALSAFQRTASYLREELGVDPGPDLRAVENRVLRHDPTLGHRGALRRWRPPARYSSLVGRDRDVARLERIVDEHRLVTLTGPGGVGKTSMAGALAEAVARRFDVAFVPLEVERDEQPAWSVVRSLGLEPTPGGDALAVIRHAIGDSPTLLMLDGAEHRLADVAPLVHRILEEGPSTRVLLTSRQPLSVSGERVVTVEPLDVGPASTAAQLFVERAGLAPDNLDTDSRRMIGEIVTTLDGLPLAIEIAAARCRTMTVSGVADQLDDLGSLLQAPNPTGARHRSLATLLDGAYDRLSVEQRSAFRQLSVFSSGVVERGDAAAVLDVVRDLDELIGDLLDVSLLSTVSGCDDVRMLEPIRQYSARRLVESGEHIATDRRLATLIVRSCEEVRRLLLTGSSTEALRLLQRRASSVTAVGKWAMSNEADDIASSIIANVGRAWFRVARNDDLIEVADWMLNRAVRPLEPPMQRALAGATFLQRFDLERGAELASLLDDEATRCRDHETSHIVHYVRAAVPHTLDRRRFYGDRSVAARSLDLLDRSTEDLAAMGFPTEPHLHGRAISLEAMGRLDEAEACLSELAAWATNSRPGERGVALEARAAFVAARGDHRGALADCDEASRLLLRGGDLDFAGSVEATRAWAHADMGDFVSGAAALARADDFRRITGLAPVSTERPELDAVIAAGSGDWSGFTVAARRYVAGAPDRSNTEQRAFFLAGERGTRPHFGRLIVPTARWCLQRGDDRRAARLLASAAVVFDRSAFSRWREIGEIDRVATATALVGEVEPVEVPTSLEGAFELLAGSVM